jgi:hypothetical protein
MVRVNWRVAWVICLAALAIAGCCRGGTNHQCEFVSPNDGGPDGNPDGPLLCGTLQCAEDHVCCVTKITPYFSCIAPADFESMGCEKPPVMGCSTPAGCPAGMTCCVTFADTIGMLSCRPELMCRADGWIVCASDSDCPLDQGPCNVFSTDTDPPFKICGAAASTGALSSKLR